MEQLPTEFHSTLSALLLLFTNPGSECHAESMYYSMHGFHRNNSHLSDEETMIVNEGRSGLDQLWEMYQDKSIWKTEKVLKNGDTVYSSQNEKYGKS
uniref:Uncharacterized protein n=1 Tax=Ciona savignyi TaxID=51511 RepID=H2ZG42_CIOSA